MMGSSAFRRMSNVFARLAVRHWSGGQPTNGRQDKSRGVRPGRSDEEREIDQRFVCEVHSPPQPAYFENPLKFSTLRTSHGSSHDWRR
jgi:hypothetical protein